MLELFENFRSAKSKANKQFVEASDREVMAEALSGTGMLTEKTGVDKAVSLLKGKNNDTGIRALALSRLTNEAGKDEQLFRYILTIVGDVEESADLRREALRQIQSINFSGLTTIQLQTETTQVLHRQVNDINVALRTEIIALLAREKDRFVQGLLVSGLRSPAMALVPDALAVHLLGFDIHATDFPLLREIVRTSPNNDTRVEAIHLLTADHFARELLVRTARNVRERFEVRKASLVALRNMDPEKFQDMAHQILTTEPNETIRQLILSGLNF